MKLTEKKASLVCCTSEGVYHKLETGETTPDQTTLNRMCIFANVGRSLFDPDISLETFEAKLKKELNETDYNVFEGFNISPDKLGEKLQIVRNAHHLTQKQMSWIANCQSQTYSKAENGKCLLNKASLICVCNFFDIRINKLLDNTLHPFIFSAEYRSRFDYPNSRKKED